MTPAKLRFDGSGRLVGRPGITYNTPWPTANGDYGSGAMTGVVMHTMVGDLPGTVAWFNNPAAQASAHFGIAQDGQIHQFGPIGKGWCAWAQAAGNTAWYSIEHADGGQPERPLTSAQVASSAQIVEALSEFAGFLLQVSDNVNQQGYGWHGMGGQEWGGHINCPGDVRKAQRATIIALARQIRDPRSFAAVRPKRKPVRKVIKKVAHGTRTTVKKEPVLSAAGLSGGLSAAVALLARRAGLHLTHDQVAAVLTILPALATIFAAIRTRPWQVTGITGALGTITTAALAFGGYLPLSYLGAATPLVTAFLIHGLRNAVSPVAAPVTEPPVTVPAPAPAVPVS